MVLVGGRSSEWRYETVIHGSSQRKLVYLVVSSGVVRQFLLKKLTKRSVLSLQVKHQHLQLDALLSQILFRDTRSSKTPDGLQCVMLRSVKNNNKCGFMLPSDLAEPGPHGWPPDDTREHFTHRVDISRITSLSWIYNYSYFLNLFIICSMNSPHPSISHKLLSDSHSPTSEQSFQPVRKR